MRPQLETAFGNCKYHHKCNCTIKDAFELTTQKQFFVIDEVGEMPVRIVSGKERFHLSVNNDTEKEICLVKTDNCLFTDDTKKCDCILFDDKQLVLAELKEATKSKRRECRVEARKQLIATIDLMSSKRINRGNYKTLALICFKSKEPRIIDTRVNSYRAIFLEKYEVHLEEKNVISFD